MSATVSVIGLIVFISIIGIAAVGPVVRRRARRSSTDTSSSRERLRRDTEWTTIIDETSEGYGTAVLHIDDGVEICSFNDQDEIYQSTWVSKGELATLADELSARACQRNRGGRA